MYHLHKLQHADGEFVGDAHRLLWVDPEQVLEDGEERDLLKEGSGQQYAANW